ncbi:MAG: hypothetical protein AB8G16_17635 [Gammaproteobacteria bacterium]
MPLHRLAGFLLFLMVTGCNVNHGAQYLEQSLLAPPVLPANLDHRSIECALANQPPDARYRTVAQVDYERPGWEQRVASDWHFFTPAAREGSLTVIDFKRVENNLAYRYLANDASHDQLYEPWSSSKIQAFTAAVAKLRQVGIGADASVGGVALADLITSINSYAPEGLADGNSNAIATYFTNVAGRDYATALLQDAWLRLANENVRLRGAYGPTSFTPADNEFISADGKTRHVAARYATAQDDPGYRAYRCAQCATVGNKAMTALAQTEWLKRLASHSREPATRHPHLQTVDVETLFFGGPRREHGNVGGMLAGISVFLPNALALALAPDSVEDAKHTLDAKTDGRWRVYQKVGWGPSETRGTSEIVMLAHVCLPRVGGSGREFTLLARAFVPGAKSDESGVGEAGLKLRGLLDRSLPSLLNLHSQH